MKTTLATVTGIAGETIEGSSMKTFQTLLKRQ